MQRTNKKQMYRITFNVASQKHAEGGEDNAKHHSNFCSCNYARSTTLKILYSSACVAAIIAVAIVYGVLLLYDAPFGNILGLIHFPDSRLSLPHTYRTYDPTRHVFDGLGHNSRRLSWNHVSE